MKKVKFSTLLYRTLSMLFLLATAMSCELKEKLPETDPTPQSSFSTDFVFGLPTTGTVGPRYYQYRLSSTMYHTGVDYLGSFNSPIMATGSGHIVKISNASPNDRGLGNCVILEHRLKSGALKYSLYAHMNSITSGLAQGDYVPRYFEIGKMGQTGAVGPSGAGGAGGVTHLHFEFKNSNVLGCDPDITGYVGYYSNIPVSNAGFSNPSSYLNSSTNRFDDFYLASNLPATITRTGAISLVLNTPFWRTSNVDLRLALYTTTGILLGAIEEKPDLNLFASCSTFSFARGGIGLTSAAGTYQLRFEIRRHAPTGNSGNYFLVPAIGSNPMTVTLN